ncbi:ankyrin repeat domain-containing protein [Planctomycetota bacterium]|nr:ankyrin repeat domain-containing protein [Planctomycetota bacterium]
MSEESKAMYRFLSSNDLVAARVHLANNPSLLHLRVHFGGKYIHEAADEFSPDSIGMLLEAGQSIEETNEEGETPLIRAVYKGKLDNVTFLLDRGANINAKTKWGANAMVYACADGHFETAKLLVERGIDLGIVYGSPTPKTLVDCARLSGFEYIAQWLLKLGAPEHPPKDAKPWKTDLDRLCEYVEPIYGKANRYVVSDDDCVLDLHTFCRSPDESKVVVSTSGDCIEIGMLPPIEYSEIRNASFVIHLPHDWPLDKASLRQSKNSWPLDRMEIIEKLTGLERVWLGVVPLLVSNDDPPQPLHPSVGFTCTMLLKDASLQPFTTDYGKTVHFYTLVPLYTEERDYEKQHGFDALWKLFDDAGYGLVIDPNRSNLAKLKNG